MRAAIQTPLLAFEVVCGSFCTTLMLTPLVYNIDHSLQFMRAAIKSLLFTLKVEVRRGCAPFMLASLVSNINHSLQFMLAAIKSLLFSFNVETRYSRAALVFTLATHLPSLNMYAVGFKQVCSIIESKLLSVI